MTQTPPESAVILFDGTDLSNWTSLDGSAPGWQVEGDAMLVVPAQRRRNQQGNLLGSFRSCRIQVPRYARSDRTGKRQQRCIPSRQI